MADLSTIKGLRSLIAGGDFTEENLAEFFAAGGSPNELMRLALSGSIASQQRGAARTEREQVGLRNALLGGGAISNLQNRQTVFNPFGGPQELQGSPLAGVDFSQVFGAGGGAEKEGGADPLQPGTGFGAGGTFGAGEGVPQPPPVAQPAPVGGAQPQPTAQAPPTPTAVQIQRQQFLEALQRRGGQ